MGPDGDLTWISDYFCFLLNHLLSKPSKQHNSEHSGITRGQPKNKEPKYPGSERQAALAPYGMESSRPVSVLPFGDLFASPKHIGTCTNHPTAFLSLHKTQCLLAIPHGSFLWDLERMRRLALLCALDLCAGQEIEFFLGHFPSPLSRVMYLFVTGSARTISSYAHVI